MNYHQGDAAPSMEVPSWRDDELVLTESGWKLYHARLHLQDCPAWMRATNPPLCGGADDKAAAANTTFTAARVGDTVLVAFLC